MDRPDWDTIFMSAAFLFAQRSPDSETKHGGVLVDKNNKLLAQGFNGFPRGCNDKELPTTRPDKYFFVLHAEDNCLMNANIIPEPEQCTLYVTGHPCHECLKKILQYGIGKVVFGGVQTRSINDDEKFQERIDLLLKNQYVKFVQYDPDGSRKADLINLLQKTISYINERA